MDGGCGGDERGGERRKGGEQGRAAGVRLRWADRKKACDFTSTCAKRRNAILRASTPRDAVKNALRLECNPFTSLLREVE